LIAEPVFVVAKLNISHFLRKRLGKCSPPISFKELSVGFPTYGIRVIGPEELAFKRDAAYVLEKP